MVKRCLCEFGKTFLNYPPVVYRWETYFVWNGYKNISSGLWKMYLKFTNNGLKLSYSITILYMGAFKKKKIVIFFMRPIEGAPKR